MIMRASATDPQIARPAVADLFLQYQQPLYSVARARGFNSEDAADAVQDFFCRLLRGELLSEYSPERGRFRTFLSVIWRRFLIDQYRRARAEKRGGEQGVVSLSAAGLEAAWKAASSQGDLSEDQVFLQQWAEALVAATRGELVASYAERGKGAVAETLLPEMTRELDRERAELLGEQLGMTAAAIKVAVHRLRERFGAILREKVAETVADDESIDDELAAILAAL
jgi:RNA polymerase sigma-70 factor (ECF subfamily)